MNEKDLSRIVQSLLHELNDPERQLSSVVRDFDECGIDYAIIGSLAVRCHNHLRVGDDIDVLVSRETYPLIEKFLVGNGYSRRAGSDRHLYVELLGGRIPIDVYVEGESREGGLPLPDPRGSRVRVLGKWYASLPLLTTLKIRSKDFGDVSEMIKANEMGAEFADSLEPDVREKFLQILSRLKATDETPTN